MLMVSGMDSNRQGSPIPKILSASADLQSTPLNAWIPYPCHSTAERQHRVSAHAESVDLRLDTEAEAHATLKNGAVVVVTTTFRHKAKGR